jgi:hypothetical protein
MTGTTNDAQLALFDMTYDGHIDYSDELQGE